MTRCVPVAVFLAASLACRTTAASKPETNPAPPAAAPVQTPPPQSAPVGTPPPIPPAGDPAADAVDQKLDSALRELVRATNDAGFQAWAAKHQVKAVDRKVPVDVACKDAAAVPSVVAALKAAGADVRTTFQNMVYATIPADAVRKTASLGEVWTMALSRPTVRPGR